MTDTLAKTLKSMGERSAARRKELGLSVNDLAILLNRTYQCVHGMERDGTTHLRVIIEWAEALDMDPAELAFGAKKKQASGVLSQASDLTESSVLLLEASKLIDGRQGKRKALVERIRKHLGA